MTRIPLALLALTVLAFAPAAQAGSSTSFADPFQVFACGSPDVASKMQDPNYFATQGNALTVRSCNALCKLGAAECKQIVATALKCESLAIAKLQQFRDANCADQGGDVKTCKVAVRSDVLNLRSQEQGISTEQTAACTNWGNNCMTQCATLASM